MLASGRPFVRTLVQKATPTIGSTAQARFYHENIVEHYENPRNVGSLDKKDRSVGTVRIRAGVVVKPGFTTIRGHVTASIMVIPEFTSYTFYIHHSRLLVSPYYTL